MEKEEVIYTNKFSFALNGLFSTDGLQNTLNQAAGRKILM